MFESYVHLEDKANTGIGFEKLVWAVFSSVSKTSIVVVVVVFVVAVVVVFLSIFRLHMPEQQRNIKCAFQTNYNSQKAY